MKWTRSQFGCTGTTSLSAVPGTFLENGQASMTRGKDHLLNLQGSHQGPWKGKMTGTVALSGKRLLLHLVICTMREGDSDFIDLIMLSATEVLPGENDNGI